MDGRVGVAGKEAFVAIKSCENEDEPPPKDRLTQNESNPKGSMKFNGLFETYLYRLPSPLENPMGSSPMNRPVFAS